MKDRRFKRVAFETAIQTAENGRKDVTDKFLY